MLKTLYKIIFLLFFLPANLMACIMPVQFNAKDSINADATTNKSKLSVKIELLTSPGIIVEPVILDNVTLGIGIGTQILYYSKKNVPKSNSFVYNPKIFIEGRYYFMEWKPKKSFFIRRIYDGAYVGLHLATSMDKNGFNKNDNHLLFGIQKSFLNRLYVNIGVGVWADRSNGAIQFYYLIPFGIGLILK